MVVKRTKTVVTPEGVGVAPIFVGLLFREVRSVTINISIEDQNWESRVDTALKHRIAFDLTDLDKLKMSQARMSSLIVGWSRRWTYIPTMTGFNSIRFVPAKLPPDNALWHIQPRDQRCGMQL
jgi:hypothetical protein